VGWIPGVLAMDLAFPLPRSSGTTFVFPVITIYGYHRGLLVL